MKIDASVLAHLLRDMEITVQVKAGALLEAMARAGDSVPEVASTVELARAWGFTPRKWREWAVAGLVEGATLDEAGSWRLPREAAREQFERALGRAMPRPASSAHLPRAHARVRLAYVPAHLLARLRGGVRGDVGLLQKSLGHRSITTTERLYGHFHDDVAARIAHARIYPEERMRAV